MPIEETVHLFARRYRLGSLCAIYVPVQEASGRHQSCFVVMVENVRRLRRLLEVVRAGTEKGIRDLFAIGQLHEL
jgi:hypothetical protein